MKEDSVISADKLAEYLVETGKIQTKEEFD
jgi:hypothetical protein